MSERQYLSILKDEPEVLTVLEVAKILRIGKNKAYDAVKKGIIPSKKIVGKIIIPKMCLIEYLCNCSNCENVLKDA